MAVLTVVFSPLSNVDFQQTGREIELKAVFSSFRTDTGTVLFLCVGFLLITVDRHQLGVCGVRYE